MYAALGGEAIVDTPDTPDTPEKEPEPPQHGIDPMSLLAALLEASGIMRVRKRPRRKR
jgi:hypothetical protein